MKNLYFALLACLLTACFRTPHLSSLPPHSPAAEAAVSLPPVPDGYASSDQVAAAGTAAPQAGEAYAQSSDRPAYLPADGEPSPAAKARPATRLAPLRRELRKAVRTALLHKRPAAGNQDDPVPAQSALPTVALVAGVLGLIALIGSFAGGAIGAGAGTAVLFLFAFLAGLTAVIAGGIAKGRIRRGLDAASGRRNATAGLVMGIVNLSLILLLLAAFIILIVAWSGGFQ
jgi:hypothetical protein